MATTSLCHMLHWHAVIMVLITPIGSSGHQMFRGISSEPSDTPATDAFLSLVPTQVTFCGTNSLCTVKSPDKSRPEKGSACCSSCSCDPSCPQSGKTCCIDHVLFGFLNNKVFTNVTELLQEVNNFDQDRKLAFETLLVDSYLNVSSDTNTGEGGIAINSGKPKSLYGQKCMAPPRTTSLLHAKPESYYEMVDTCLHGDDVKNAGLDPKRHFDNVPVTSLETGLSYVNKAFLACNEGESKFEYWDMYYICFWGRRSLSFLPDFSRNPFIVLENRRRLSLCDVSFEPSRVIKERVMAPECSKLEAAVCPITNTSNEKSIFMSNFCKRNNNNVELQITDTRKWMVYKNVACIICKDIWLERGLYGCSAQTFFKLRVNLDSLPKIGTQEELMVGSQLLESRLLYGDANSSVCPDGHVYIPVLDDCRSVFCPRSMYIVNGSCVPLFGRATGAFYKAVINVTIVSPLFNGFAGETFEGDLYDFLHNDLFKDEPLNIEAIDIISLGPTFYMVELILSDTQYSSSTLSDVVRSVSSRYYTRTTLKLANSESVKIAISPAPMNYFDKRTVRDRTAPFRNPSGYFVIGISRSYTCYRIGINADEFTFISKRQLKVLATDLDVYREDFDFDHTTQSILVCLDFLLQGPRYFGFEPLPEDHIEINGDFLDQGFENVISDGGDDNEELLYHGLMALIGVVVIVLCVGTRLLMEKVTPCLSGMRPRNGEMPATNTQEMANRNSSVFYVNESND